MAPATETTYTLRSAHIFVADLASAREFYIGAMGMPLLLESRDFLILDTGVCGVMVFESRDGTDPVGVGTGLHFGVADIDATYRELSAKGVRFTGEPLTHDWGGRMVSFLDSSNNHLSLVQYPN